MFVGTKHPVIVESDLRAGSIKQSKGCIAQRPVHSEIRQRRPDGADEDFLRREPRNNETSDEDILAGLDGAARGKIDQGVTGRWQRIEGYCSAHITATHSDRLHRELPETTDGEVFRIAGQAPCMVIGRQRRDPMFVRIGETDEDLIIQGVSQRELDARTRRAILVLHRHVHMVSGLDRVECYPGKSLRIGQGDR